MLELPITQTRHYLSNPPPPKQKEKILTKCAQKGGAHFKCVNNYFASFEYKRMKTFGVTDYTN